MSNLTQHAKALLESPLLWARLDELKAEKVFAWERSRSAEERETLWNVVNAINLVKAGLHVRFTEIANAERIA